MPGRPAAAACPCQNAGMLGSSRTPVLLVDDDAELGAMLSEYFECEGFDTTLVNDGEQGVIQALGGRHDIVILDVMMPGISGVEALRRIRARSQVPILMLTARGDDVDRILGLELGADDYVPKPSSAREIVARLRAILRRLQPQPAGIAGDDSVLKGGAVSMWPRRREAECQGKVLQLTGAEFNLLEVLVSHAGTLVTRAQLSEHGLSRPLTRFDRSIDVHISSIRQKLAQATGGIDLIRTVRGTGYLLMVE